MHPVNKKAEAKSNGFLGIRCKMCISILLKVSLPCFIKLATKVNINVLDRKTRFSTRLDEPLKEH